MGRVAVEGMRFHALHGYYPEEQLTGNAFGVDVWIETEFSRAAQEDDLSGTINYEIIYREVAIVMSQPVQLLEYLANLIIDRLKVQFAGMRHITVRVSKYHPPLGGEVGRVCIEESRSFLSECPGCGQQFIDYGDDTCWCRSARTSQAGDCRCPECLGD